LWGNLPIRHDLDEEHNTRSDEGFHPGRSVPPSRAMPRFDATTAECRVFTFKDGLLSAVAHDLELTVKSFEIDVAEDRSSLRARFDARSIEVVEPIVDGRRSPGTLSDKDKAKIQSNIVSEVIPVKKHPDIRFESTELREEEGGWLVRGRLELAGRAKEITVRARREGDRAVARVTLHQPDYGIKPYTAMLGTLKIKPDLDVELRIPI
jgi:polyisoprenoid-binding protein YceI